MGTVRYASSKFLSWLRWLGRLAACCCAGYAVWLALMVPLYDLMNPRLSLVMLLRAVEGVPPIQTWRPLARISPNVVRAVLISEDSQFCQHWGVDWQAVAEAM
jgi:monofunctional glycosyltransferase